MSDEEALKGFSTPEMENRKISKPGSPSQGEGGKAQGLVLASVFASVFFMICLGMCGGVDSSSVSLSSHSSTGQTRSQVLDRLSRLLAYGKEGCSTAYNRRDYSYSASLEYNLVLQYGGIYDLYEDRWYGDGSYDSMDHLAPMDIEHIIAIKEAHDSGLCRATKKEKKEFASDTLNLVLTKSTINRQKQDKDAADWVPEANKCWFAERVITIRERYKLTIDEREREALKSIINTCESFDLRMSPDDPLNPLLDESKGCPDPRYSNCDELKKKYSHGVYKDHCAYSAHMDRDSDGWICIGM